MSFTGARRRTRGLPSWHKVWAEPREVKRRESLPGTVPKRVLPGRKPSLNEVKRNSLPGTVFRQAVQDYNDIK